MSGLFGNSIPRRAEATPPTLANPAIDAARADALSQGANVFGRQQTILTGMGGSTSSGTVQRKTLLGG